MEKTGYRSDLFFENQVKALSPKEWMTTEEAAIYLGLTPGALRNMTSNGSIPYYKLGRRNRYRSDELRSLLSSKKKGVAYGI